MAIPRPTESEILQRIYNRILNDTPITANLDSSVIGVLLKIIAAEMNLVWNYIEELYSQTNLSTATGQALDNFGLLLGVPRKQAVNASTLGSSRAVRFTNLSAGAVTIPTGTRVFKELDPQVAYYTIEGATILPGQALEMHVKAVFEGDSYNVGIGELNRHSVPNVNVSVTNILPIQSGSLEESDAAYRERLLQEMIRRDVLNPSNCDAMLRAVPGVKDVYIIDFKRGSGTFDAIIIPYNESAVSSVVDSCQNILNEFVPIGISALARPPQFRQLDVSVNLRFDPRRMDRKESIRESIRAQIIARVDNLPVENGTGNGTFYTNQIRASSLLSGTEVLDAVVSLGLDGSPIAPEGEIRLGIGERLVLRSLSVE
jgi:uncharacterized phage protein gp47/JayE